MNFCIFTVDKALEPLICGTAKDKREAADWVRAIREHGVRAVVCDVSLTGKLPFSFSDLSGTARLDVGQAVLYIDWRIDSEGDAYIFDASADDGDDGCQLGADEIESIGAMWSVSCALDDLRDTAKEIWARETADYGIDD